MMLKKFLATIIVALLFLPCLAMGANSLDRNYVVVYGSHTCPACRKLLDFFNKTEVPYVFHDLVENEKYAELFYDLISIAKLDAAVPTSAVIVEGKVEALVQGAILDSNFWKSLLNRTNLKNNVLYIFYLNYEGRVYTRLVTNESVINRVNSIVVVEGSHIVGGESSNVGLAFNIVSLLLPLALADSVNPCAIVFLAIIVSSIAFTSRTKKYITALAYVLGVYMTYFLIGVGLSFILGISRLLLILVAIAGYSFIILNSAIFTRVKQLSYFFSSFKRKMLVKIVSKYSIPLVFAVGYSIFLYFSFSLNIES